MLRAARAAGTAPRPAVAAASARRSSTVTMCAVCPDAKLADTSSAPSL
ncbi:Uncharacterised protein [Mycobacteroides abscessus subsp. abscessus]|nr:Uncharacterised protein [Mycobacteroides abscessus subsp. abscessus]